MLAQACAHRVTDLHMLLAADKIEHLSLRSSKATYCGTHYEV